MGVFKRRIVWGAILPNESYGGQLGFPSRCHFRLSNNVARHGNNVASAIGAAIRQFYTLYIGAPRHGVVRAK